MFSLAPINSRFSVVLYLAEKEKSQSLHKHILPTSPKSGLLPVVTLPPFLLVSITIETFIQQTYPKFLLSAGHSTQILSGDGSRHMQGAYSQRGQLLALLNGVSWLPNVALHLYFRSWIVNYTRMGPCVWNSTLVGIWRELSREFWSTLGIAADVKKSQDR